MFLETLSHRSTEAQNAHWVNKDVFFKQAPLAPVEIKNWNSIDVSSFILISANGICSGNIYQRPLKHSPWPLSKSMRFTYYWKKDLRKLRENICSNGFEQNS